MKTVIDVLRVALIVFAIADALYLLFVLTEVAHDIRGLLIYLADQLVGLPEGIEITDERGREKHADSSD